MMRFLLTLLALVATLALPAALTAAPVVQNPNTRVELIADTPSPGQPRTFGIVLTPKPGWHTYWQNPGEAGFAPKAAWTLPPGATARALRYPVPETLLVSGLMNYVYAAPATLLADISGLASEGLAEPVGLKLDYLVCTVEICVPESATLTLDADVSDPARIAAAKAALPKALPGAARFAVAKERFALAVPLADPKAVTAAYFFPLTEGAIDYASPQIVSVTRDGLRIETKAGGTAAAVAGVLRVTRGTATTGYALSATPGAVPSAGPIVVAGLPAPGPVIAAGTVSRRGSPASDRSRPAAGNTSPPGASSASFITALVFAIAGGVILNVMPCVFPILSLKALSLARGGATPAEARHDALAYAAGVTLVCVALGGIVLALAAAGSAVGWGFQLQNPRVVAGLLLLVTAIALNLAGLFEVGGFGGGQSLASKPGATGSFWTGALAAFVATPCTGPFMAGALGAALVLPPLAGLLVFAGLGLGLALPFVAIGFVPALRRRLPKPGAWMASFRHLLSVPMFLTALGLAWLLGRQAGVAGMTLGLGGALLVGLALWWYGGRQRGERSGVAPLLAAGAAAVLAIGVVAPAASAGTSDAGSSNAGSPAAATDAPAGLNATRFSEPALDALRAAKTPAFVYFTADWCLTCKVNERGALSSATVAAAFKRAGIATLVGDWTSSDPELGRFIAAHGRAGVPLYLFYHADGRVDELPQILTVDRLTALAA